MISNGTLLPRERLRELQAAGLNRINLTVNTCAPDRYEKLMGGTILQFSRLMTCIEDMSSLGFDRPKLNFVYLGPSSDSDLQSVIELARQHKVSIRLLNILALPEKPPHDLAPNGVAVAYLIDKAFSLGAAQVSLLPNPMSLPVLAFELQGDVSLLIGHHRVGDLAPFKSCRSCAVRSYCSESIYAFRLTPEGSLQPCLVRQDNALDLLPFANGAIDESTATSLVAEYLSEL
jgi:molybdenum cofactor biosynthesis enzyme MoaA